MMHYIENPESETWFVARCEDGETIHYGSVQPGQTMRTGQPVLETYPTEQAWLEALAVLGVDPNEITHSYQR